MQKINFQNLPSTATPINATNLNDLQDNVEDAIDLKADQDYIDGTKPMGNVVVDSIKGKNMFDSDNPSAIASGITWTGSGKTHYLTSTISFGGGIRWFIPIKAGEEFTFSYKQRNNNNIFLYIRETNAIEWSSSSTLKTIVNDGTNTTYSFTTENNGYLGIAFQTSSSVSNVLIEELQLEKGLIPTIYAEYQGLGYTSGSNANGNYIKYDDGTLICWNRIVVSSVAITSAEGSLYKSDNITPFPDYPIQFVDNPSLSMESISDDGPRYFWIVKSQGDGNARIRGIRLFAATSMTVVNAKLSYIAIGRWK